MKPHLTIAAALAAAAVLAAGCGRSGSPTQATATQAAVNTSSGDFGTLKGVCGPGSPSSAPDQGVTASQIQVGVFNDTGFNQDPSYLNAANVFASWCNAAGGIAGRKIAFSDRDAAVLNVVPQMLNSCRQDFAIVGGAAALDGLAVTQRLKCLMPAFPAQVVMPSNISSALQVYPGSGGYNYFQYEGFDRWLTHTAYPGSAGHVALLVGDSPVTKILAAEYSEAFKAMGDTVVYNGLYPAAGVSDWTPYAQTLKAKGVKGLFFLGSYTDIAKLEQTLTTMNYKLDWIDPNDNSYFPAFIQLLGPAAKFQNNITDLNGTYPLEKGTANSAVRELYALFAKYDAQGQVTLPVLRAFSAWLLFAKAASSCGDNLTRRCVYEAALSQHAWTAGGLQAPVDMATQDSPVRCFNAEQATAQGWQPAPAFKTTSGPYNCDAPAYKYTGNYGKPATLADVGKNMSQFK